MCGRFTLRTPAADWLPMFHIAENEVSTSLAPRYNIAPTQMVAAIRMSKDDDQAANSQNELVQLKWGLIPSWAKDATIGSRMINARSETIAEKPSFRSAFKKKRCLIVADGFYEWKKIDSKTKQPYHIRMKDQAPFAVAGLWEYWNKGEHPIESCTIITTEANEIMDPLHDRMPVILSEEDWPMWLDSTNCDKTALQQKMIPFPSEMMETFAVDPIVNNARHEDARCIEPVKTNLEFDF